MTRKSTKPETAGEGVSAEVSEFAQEYPTVGETEIDSDTKTAETVTEYSDGSETHVESPVHVDAEDATVTTEADGAEGIKTADGKVVTEADQAQVGAAPSGIDADGKVGGYDPSENQRLLRPFDAAPYVSSADEQRDIRLHADMATRTSREERERRASDALAAATRS